MKYLEQEVKRPAIENISFFQACPAALLETIADSAELAGTVRVSGNGDSNTGVTQEPSIFGRHIEPVGAGIQLKEAASIFGVTNDSLKIQFTSRTLEQQPAGSMTEDGEVAVMLGCAGDLGTVWAVPPLLPFLSPSELLCVF